MLKAVQPVIPVLLGIILIEAALGIVGAVMGIQMASRGYVSPESFTHGSAEQRMRWFRRGLDTGDLKNCDAFAAAQL